MAGLENPPGLGLNSWFEDAWARAQAASSARFVVAHPTAWRPSAHSGLDRTVNILPGGGWHCGVWDETDATETVQLEPNTTTADRHDAVVSRVDWDTGTRTFAVVRGSTVPPPIANFVQPGAIVRAPSVRYDGLVAIVRVRPGVGVLAANDVSDMRVWHNGSTITSPLNGWALMQDISVGAIYFRENGATQELFVRTPSGLERVPLATGATSTAPANVSLSAGVANYVDATIMPVIYWRDGNTAFLTGTLRLVGELGGLGKRQVGVLPVGFRPVATVTAPTNFEGRFEVLSSGVVNLVNGKLPAMPNNSLFPLNMVFPTV